MEAALIILIYVIIGQIVIFGSILLLVLIALVIAKVNYLKAKTE